MVVSPKPLTTNLIMQKTIQKNRAGESLLEVGIVGVSAHPNTSPTIQDNAAQPDKITLVKLNGKNEFNINWVTARQSVTELKPLYRAACMAYELISHLQLY